MELIQQLLHVILNIDQQLVAFTSLYGIWIYGLLFLIIFCETGLVVTPFLPGDSLLFAAGALTATSNSVLNIHLLFLLLLSASIAGNTVNYCIGRFIGPKVFSSESSWFFNKRYLNQAHTFYETYGAKTLIIARFIPIIRTFAPFLAGIGYMSLRQFTLFNVIGAILWVGGLLYVSYLFGNIPIVQTHFSLIVLLIIGLSLLPPIVEIIRRRLKSPT